MFADHLAVVHGLEKESISLLDEDVKMIAPELDHDLVELAFAIELPQQGCLAQFIRHRLTVIAIEDAVADAFQFIGIHPQCLEGSQADLGIEIVDGFKIKLFLDPRLQADLREVGAFLHARTEGQVLQGEEVPFVQRSPRDSREPACDAAVDGGTGG